MNRRTMIVILAILEIVVVYFAYKNFGVNGALVAIAASLVAYLGRQQVVAYRARRTAPPAGQAFDWGLVNTSFVLAALAGLLIGYVIGLPVGRSLANATGFSRPFLMQSLVALGVAALWVLWTYHNTPTNHKTAMLLFGTKRVRMGPRGFGFEEGLNGKPLGWPFFVAVDKNISQQVEPFKQMKAYSKDKQPVRITGTYTRYIDDVYRTYDVSSEAEAIESLESMTLKWIRGGAEAYDAETLVSQEANGNPTKDVLAKKAFDNVQAELASDASVGYNIKPIQINEIDLDLEFENALKAKSREMKEGEAEQVQIDRRLEQLDSVIAKKVNPDLAAGFVQVEAEKPGAKVTTFNIPGIQGIGEAAGNFGKAAAEWLSKKT